MKSIHSVHQVLTSYVLSLIIYCAGFVRFIDSEGVKHALKKYREFEIEIQDVSIAIKVVKAERH